MRLIGLRRRLIRGLWSGAGRSSFPRQLVLDLLCAEDALLPGLVVQGLRLLEDDALGGGGSRGSGCVRFDQLKLTWRGKDYYARAQRSVRLRQVWLAGLQSKVRSANHSSLFSEWR